MLTHTHTHTYKQTHVLDTLDTKYTHTHTHTISQISDNNF